jgi:hypothetical protein
MIDEEIRAVEREVASGDKAKLFELARLRGRAGLGPGVGRIDLDRKTIVDESLFDTEITVSYRPTLFFSRNWAFDDGERKIIGQDTNHLAAGNSLPAGFAMAVTGIRLLVMNSHGRGTPTYADTIKALEGWVHFAVGVHDHEGLSWRARDVANGIVLDGPRVLEELVLFKAEWKPSYDLPKEPSLSRVYVRLALEGVVAKPPG